MFKALKTIWASSDPRSVPTDRYGSNISESRRYKSTLPKNPTHRILRNFAKNPVVNRPITAVVDRVTRLKYEIVPKVNGRKYTKQISIVKNIIESPNMDMTRRQLESILLNDLLTLDAGTFEVCRSNNPKHPLFLYPIDGATVQHVIPMNYTDPNADKYMQLNDKGNIFFKADELCFIRKDCFSYKPFGLSPVNKAYDYIKYFLDSADSAADNVNIKTAGMMIDLGEDVTKELVDQFREYFTNDIEGTGHIPIIGGSKNAKTHQIRSFTEDGLYMTWLTWLEGVIANAFPFPLQLMNVNMSTDRSTTEDFETRITEELVKPYACLLEDAYNTHVINLLGFGGILEFRYVFEDSENMKSQKWTRLNSAYQAGWLTENELRTLAGFVASTSKYANYTSDERKALINKELGIQGYNGLGNIKDTSQIKKDKRGDSDG